MTPQFPRAMVIDGGLATELERRGCDLSGPLWSAHVLLERPEIVQAVHADYLEAGADCLITASYQVSFEGFARVGLAPADTVAALNRSIALATAARAQFAARSSRRIWLAASLGPYGATLGNGAEYHGRYDVTFEDLITFHRSRLEHLQHAAVDLIACETVPSIEEARAMLAALAAYPRCRAWLSFTCGSDHATGAGDAIVDAVRLAAASPQVVSVGINCTSPQYVAPLIDTMVGETTKPLVVYPNSGEGWDAAARRWSGHDSIADFGTQARDWYRRGARWIGGCCRTTPEHITQVRRMIDTTANDMW